MPEDLAGLVREHRAFYEVLPYYVVLEERHGNLPATAQRIQAGFDVDVYGEDPGNRMTLPGADPDYARGYAELEKIAEAVARNIGHGCAVEVIRFPSTVILDTKNQQREEGTLRVRICHYRGLGQPFGPSEQSALEEIERQLKSMGVARR